MLNVLLESWLATFWMPKFCALHIMAQQRILINVAFFTAGNDAVIRAWNIMSQGLQCELKGHKDSVTCLSLDANFLFSGSDDKSIRMWNVTNITDAYEVTCFENAHSRPIRDLKIQTI